MRANEFWKQHQLERNKVHICDVPKEVFYARHKHALTLIGKYTYREIGTLIAGKYYDNLWGSRSCSGTLSHLLGGDDFMDFYCGGSDYYYIINAEQKKKDLYAKQVRRYKELVEDFNREDAKDGSSI